MIYLLRIYINMATSAAALTWFRVLLSYLMNINRKYSCFLAFNFFLLAGFKKYFIFLQPLI